MTEDRRIRVAYADPPYPGLAQRYYGYEEVDHLELVARLCAEYPDGWALSTSSKAARWVWALCPNGAVLHPWFRGCRRVPSRRPLDSWEALIVCGGRASREPTKTQPPNALIAQGRQHTHPGALIGMKPAPFCEWMFQLLGLEPGDELVDLFPGSGAVQRAWTLFSGGVASDVETVPSRRARTTV